MNAQNLMQDKVFSVSELNSYIKELLETSFSYISIEGEISNFKRHSQGHLYFNLKDNTSLISAVMFRGNAQTLKFDPKDGTKVQCKGRVTVYPPQGKYQIVITEMKVQGQGDILQMLELLKQKLYKEGLFNVEHKKTLPLIPKTIGIVTSPTGAALRDILQITKRRNKTINVIIYPCLVQGQGSSESIVRQIEIANRFPMCDVLIVGRGGGSLEDLLPFSDERVVRAIYRSDIPVVSAVGHEIDWALSDYVADKRAPTPSAAAELCVPEIASIRDNINQHKKDLHNTVSTRLEKARLVIKSFSKESLELQFRSIEQPYLIRYERATEDLKNTMLQKIKDYKTELHNLKALLESSSPESAFERGFSMVRHKDSKKIIRNPFEVTKGNEVEIVVSKGTIFATVDSTTETKEL